MNTLNDLQGAGPHSRENVEKTLLNASFSKRQLTYNSLDPYTDEAMTFFPKAMFFV